MNDSPVDNSIPKLLVTGRIPRTTTYEKGFPLQYNEDLNTNNLIPDPLVNDDQAIVANIKNKGLVVISGCTHAGIINTIRYAKLLTGINKIYSVIGGFHLTGGGCNQTNNNRIEKDRSKIFNSLPLYGMESYQPNNSRTA